MLCTTRAWAIRCHFGSSGYERPGAGWVLAPVMLPRGVAGAPWRVRHTRCERPGVNVLPGSLSLAPPRAAPTLQLLTPASKPTRRGQPALRRRPPPPLRAGIQLRSRGGSRFLRSMRAARSSSPAGTSRPPSVAPRSGSSTTSHRAGAPRRGSRSAAFPGSATTTTGRRSPLSAASSCCR